jgi:transcriptional regulator with XRE-family HTH domain
VNRLTMAGYQPGLGRRLAWYRLRAGLTQFELAEASGVKSHAMISKYESGRRAPSMATLVQLAKAVDVDLKQLLEGPC